MTIPQVEVRHDVDGTTKAWTDAASRCIAMVMGTTTTTTSDAIDHIIVARLGVFFSVFDVVFDDDVVVVVKLSIVGFFTDLFSTIIKPPTADRQLGLAMALLGGK